MNGETEDAVRKSLAYRQLLFPDQIGEFPSTRYQGSKAKLVPWIWEQIANLDFATCINAFGGTGAIAYRLKQAGKQVTYNDLLRFNYYIGLALIENSNVSLNPEKVDWLLQRHPEISYVLHEKWRIAAERPGSGNTKNIGLVRDIRALVNGSGPFVSYGEECLMTTG